MRIFLLGMPASGKSTFGKALAKQLNYPFLDLDRMIIEAENSSIPQIFERFGENYFREAERQALLRVLDFPKGIIATGGGTPCFFDNLQIINQNGLSIFLNVPIPDLAQHILADAPSSRPLFASQNLDEIMKKLDEIYTKRIFYYQKSKLRLDF